VSNIAHVLTPDLRYRAAMSERSIYLRDQAAKCNWHANNLSDAETQAELRKLAAEYIAEAAEIERRKGASVGPN
jgi:hypothetical protein